MTQPGKLLRVAPPKGSNTAQLLENLKTAALNLNAGPAQIFADEIATTRHAQDPLLRYSFEVAHIFFGKVGATGKAPIIERGNLARIRNRRVSDLAFHFISKYNQTPVPEERNAIYQEYLREFSSEGDRMRARSQFWGLYRGLKRSAGKRAAESSIIRQGEN